MAAEHEVAPNPRAFWSGTLTFGLVSVPVDLYPAVRSRRTALRMLGPDDQPLVRRYFCSADGRALTSDDIVRGYENDDGSFTIVADEELDALAPRKSRDIDLRRFVEREEIPRQLLERPYVLGAGRRVDEGVSLAGRDDGARRPRRHRDVRHARQGVPRGDLRRRRHAARRDDALRRRAAHAGRRRACRQPRRPSAERRQEMERALAELTADELDVELLEDEYAAKLLELARAETRRRRRTSSRSRKRRPRTKKHPPTSSTSWRCSSSAWAPAR